MCGVLWGYSHGLGREPVKESTKVQHRGPGPEASTRPVTFPDSTMPTSAPLVTMCCTILSDAEAAANTTGGRP